MSRKAMSDARHLPGDHDQPSVFGRPFSLIEPAALAFPVIVDVPHAGRQYPPGFVASSRLGAHALRRSEDAYVDRLFHDVVGLGAPMLVAEFPRAYLDVNREPYELDPRMFDGRLPGFANTRSLRVAGGLGTVPKMVGDGQEIYRGRIPVADALARIEHLYRPYHAALRALTNNVATRFGACVLVDAHSMPATSLDREGLPKADVVLGDRYGTSAAGWIVDVAELHLRHAGFSVVRNRPYAGGFITESYGDPQRRQHAIQFEISRALYMDESRIEPHAGFDSIRAAIGDAMSLMMRDWRDGLCAQKLAAE